MGEPVLNQALDVYIEHGSRNEKQLARLAKDLIALAGHDPNVVILINQKVGSA